MVSVDFWWKLFNKGSAFFRIYGIYKYRLLLHGIAQNSTYKILSMKTDIDMIYADVAHYGRCYADFNFFHINKVKVFLSLEKKKKKNLVILIERQVLGCLENNWTIIEKCLSAWKRGSNFLLCRILGIAKSRLIAAWNHTIS